MELLEKKEIVEVDLVDPVIKFYCNRQTQFLLEQFLNQVKTFFELNPTLHTPPFPVAHSIKARLKDPEHLRDKLKRKAEKGIKVTENSLLCEVTDLAGVRVLHLYQDQFETIHTEIIRKVDCGDWVLGEDPKAYTWDPETKAFFGRLGILTEVRDSYYTSVHYLVKPNNKSDICCEIQVRTLFEEIWGEIDHAINYPHKVESIACAEQLRVLSKLVSTGTRLSDSIFRSYKEYVEKTDKDL
ncbi:RelA/SpoT domain-containing protein [Desulfosporosinus sp. PR]|uniref:RelA/SpoT domain-containing protein n=1 Tax=Candidatus Desulfosporosinus nitrosoreducens TaxID=3401928 RepID=UPI0027FC6A06|nr:RelA/SpoT domain-containing protein [Desulfosporosinus sp. PR]MDQ7095471.1 RelA/SpoT domain-containing protein [Desulfosporosinus sp. PR]